MSDVKIVIEKIMSNEDKNLVDIVLNIVNKINNLPAGTKTTIAEIINYDAQKAFIEPLTQGKIYNFVKAVCKELNIKLEQHRDGFGGLAYFYAFTKC